MLRFWRTVKGNLMLTFPYTVFLSNSQPWGCSYKSYNFVVSDDTTTPYSILHVGPYEFFIRPKVCEMDWF